MGTDFDGVAETLELLRSRGYVLGTITNGNADVEQTVRKPLKGFRV
jgi:FMN phosphatase YigB (HAD superfamily)